MKLYFKIAGDGLPLVMTSGLGGISADWSFFLERLSENYKVLAWDHRGHGQSDRSDRASDYDPDYVLDDLGFVLETAGATESNPGVLVGHSLGGYCSLRFALTKPELVRALILIATGPGFRNAASRSAWNESVMAGDFGKDLTPEARRLGIQNDSFVAENVSMLRMPVLVIVGERDTAFINAHDYFMKNISQATSAVIPHAGHNLYKTHGEQVLKAILNFLDT